MRPGRWAVAAVAMLLVATGLGPSAADGSRPGGPAVESWVTDLSTDQRLERQPRLSWWVGAGRAGRTVVVDPTRRYQEMTGFGASMTDSSAYVLSRLSPQVRRQTMTELFSTSEGIGLSMLRQPMGASDFAVGRPYSYDEQPEGRTDPDLSGFSIAHDRAYILPRLREAYALNPELSFMASPWSAPGWMKDTGSLITGSLLPRHAQAYADYFARFIRSYERAGIPTHFVSMQNEPLYEPEDYPGMRMLPDQAATFLGRHLGPTLAREGLDTRILGYDHNWDITDYAEAMFAVPGVNRYVAGTAWHCYAGEATAQSVSHNHYPHAQAFGSECSGGAWQGTRAEAFEQTMASVIGVPRNWGQSVVLWNLALDERNGPFIGGCDACRGIVRVDDDGTVTKELDYWALGHASSFVPPGSVRIGSSRHQGLVSVAFSEPDGRQVLIAHNASGQAQTFDVQVGSRHFTAELAAGAAATYRWRAPEALAPAGELGWVDLDFGPGPPGTPTGRLTASVGPEVIGELSQVKLPDGWLAYALPYGAELRTGTPARALPRAGWRVTAAGGEPVENESLADLLDGNRATRWSSGTGQRKGMALTVDLGRSTRFSQIALDAGASFGDYLRRYSVQVSDDGVAWTEIARGPGRTTLDGLMTIALPLTAARHLRLVSRGTSGSWWSIAELNLGLAPPAGAVPGGPDLVSDSGRLPDGTPVTGHYNAGSGAATVPWPVPGFGSTYRLPPRAAVTFAVLGDAPVDPEEPRSEESPGLRAGG